MIRAVTFDCWGTLLTERDFSAAHDARVRGLLEAAGELLDEEAARDLLERGWRAHHAEWVAGRQAGSPAIARFCVTELGLDADGHVERLTACFEEAAVSGMVVALDGAVENLRRLREAGIRTALVCDTGFTPGRVVRRFLEDTGLLPHLEHLAFSDEVGVPKPDVRMFRAALDAVDVPPEEAVHVGDLLRTDIAGARAAGMGTVRIAQVNDDDHDLPEADAVIGHHDELLDALAGLGLRLQPSR